MTVKASCAICVPEVVVIDGSEFFEAKAALDAHTDDHQSLFSMAELVGPESHSNQTGEGN